MFTQSWEDPECDLRALRPRPGERLLAITSGGDNVLGFLLADPEEIVAVDYNGAQTALLELKQAAFRRLSYPDMLLLMGLRTGAQPTGLYPQLRGDLSDDARAYWDAHLDLLSDGLLLQGGFERYFAMVRRMLRLVVGRRRLERLFTLEPEEQRDFYEKEWNRPSWRAFVRVVCSRYVLGRRLDPSWFAHAEVSSFGEHFLKLVEHAVAELPAKPNYFLAQILLGRYLDERTVPAYLLEENFGLIKERVDRITPVTDDIGAAVERLPAASIDGFALSNVFEYSPVELFDRTAGALVRAARPGARFCLRNLVAPRLLESVPAFAVDKRLSAALRAQDRGFIYSRFEAATLASPAERGGGGR